MIYNGYIPYCTNMKNVKKEKGFTHSWDDQKMKRPGRIWKFQNLVDKTLAEYGSP